MNNTTKIKYNVNCPMCGQEIVFTPSDVYPIGQGPCCSDIEAVDCHNCKQQVVLTGLKPKRTEYRKVKV